MAETERGVPWNDAGGGLRRDTPKELSQIARQMALGVEVFEVTKDALANVVGAFRDRDADGQAPADAGGDAQNGAALDGFAVVLVTYDSDSEETGVAGEGVEPAVPDSSSSISAAIDRIDLLLQHAESHRLTGSPMFPVVRRTSSSDFVVPEQDLPAARLAWAASLSKLVREVLRVMPYDIADAGARGLLELVHPVTSAAFDLEDDNRLFDAVGDLTDVARSVRRRLNAELVTDPAEARDYVLQVLGGVDRASLATILGVSVRTVSSWRRGGPVRRQNLRLVVVAEVVQHLRSSMTATGVQMWFSRPRSQLGGRTPLEALDTNVAGARDELLHLAHGLHV